MLNIKLQNSKIFLLVISAALLFFCWVIYNYYDHTAVQGATRSFQKMLRAQPVKNSVIPPNSALMYPVVTNDEAFALYALRLSRKEASCGKFKIFGQGDGVKKICMTTNYLLKSPCLVYSFGIADDFSFDRAMVTQFGCEVFAFDPSNGLPNHTVIQNLHFYSIGLAGSNIDGYLAPKGLYTDGKTKWKLRTLKTLLHAMKHQDRIIDILKLDIEEWEFEALEEALSSGVLSSVKQMNVEFHVFGEELKRQYLRHLTLLINLYNAGFRIVFLSNHNCRTDHYCHQVDIHFVNKNFD